MPKQLELFPGEEAHNVFLMSDVSEFIVEHDVDDFLDQLTEEAELKLWGYFLNQDV